MRGSMLTHWPGCCRLSGGDGARSFSVSTAVPGGRFSVTIAISILSAVGNRHRQGLAGLRDH